MSENDDNNARQNPFEDLRNQRDNPQRDERNEPLRYADRGDDMPDNAVRTGNARPAQDANEINPRDRVDHGIRANQDTRPQRERDENARDRSKDPVDSRPMWAGGKATDQALEDDWRRKHDGGQRRDVRAPRKVVQRRRVLSNEELNDRVFYLETVIERLHDLVHAVAGHAVPAFVRGRWHEEVDASEDDVRDANASER